MTARLKKKSTVDPHAMYAAWESFSTTGHITVTAGLASASTSNAAARRDDHD